LKKSEKKCSSIKLVSEARAAIQKALEEQNKAHARVSALRNRMSELTGNNEQMQREVWRELMIARHDRFKG
jgi:hypothetical protein